MVKHLNAYIARATVNGALGAKNHASEAELETHHACLLTVKTINDEIVFESYAPLARVLIIWLLRNEARIRSRSLVKKDIDKDPKKNSESERKVVLVSQNVIDPGEAKSKRIDYVDEQSYYDKISRTGTDLNTAAKEKAAHTVPDLIFVHSLI